MDRQTKKLIMTYCALHSGDYTDRLYLKRGESGLVSILEFIVSYNGISKKLRKEIRNRNKSVETKKGVSHCYVGLYGSEC